MSTASRAGAARKSLVPGIHAMGERMHIAGELVRPITLSEAETVAGAVFQIRSVSARFQETKAQIRALAGMDAVSERRRNFLDGK